MEFNEDTTFPEMMPPPQDSSPPRLLVASGSEAGKEYPLVRFPLLIGREPSTDIQLQSTTVSRSHARISKDKGEIVLSDLGSTNGIFVNNFKVRNWILRDGDSIRIGDTIFLFRSEQKSGQKRNVV